MTSLTTMVTQLCAMIGTPDLTEWEASFIDSIDDRTQGGKDTRGLSEKQVEKVQSIWARHFA